MPTEVNRLSLKQNDQCYFPPDSSPFPADYSPPSRFLLEIRIHAAYFQKSPGFLHTRQIYIYYFKGHNKLL